MKKSWKPIRKCYSCLLNQGDHCWLFKYPFRAWQKLPNVKTRHELRREFFRSSKQKRHPSEQAQA